MKTKTANLTVCKKFDEWVASITDGAVRDMVEKGSILTGGAIASMLLKEPINDFDFYFKDIQTVKAVAEYYVHSARVDDQRGPISQDRFPD